MSDPRNENCRRFSETGGMVTGVELTHVPMPATKYELLKVALIDERAAQGNIVARVSVMDQNGIQATVNCWMAWPWKGQMPGGWEGRGLPGNMDYPYKHMITNTYNPFGGQGPLAIYIGDANGAIESDVVGGLGLPGGHHVSFDLVFRERGAGGDSGGDGNDTGDGSGSDTGGGSGGGAVSGDVAAQLQRIEDKIDRIARQFGIQF